MEFFGNLVSDYQMMMIRLIILNQAVNLEGKCCPSASSITTASNPCSIARLSHPDRLADTHVVSARKDRHAFFLCNLFRTIF